ncbi:hypothetical protein F511_34826 [Dorcoceras hygrometricum]|uniref:Uncharacterized protein n=1 Tax=Dorcoceras hygrometricum TaxID=472368 RepID=A0A2Z7B868_9LAMI|nr:hypothetical protein F511_34826 [Dorcoceras hygrometricum]
MLKKRNKSCSGADEDSVFLFVNVISLPHSVIQTLIFRCPFSGRDILVVSELTSRLQQPKRDGKKNDDRSKKDDRRSTERRRTRFEKKPNRKNDRKVLVSEESNKNWADSDSETTSSSSSSESEQEEVHCLMANQSTDDEVFDFSNSEFTREDLINALNEMVHEQRHLYRRHNNHE